MWSFRHDFLCPLFWQAQGEQFTFLHCTAWCIQVVNVVKMPGGWLCISIVVNISHYNFAIFPCFVQKSIIGYPYWDASPKPCMHFSRLQVFSIGNYNIICYFLMSGTFFAGETCTPLFDHLPFIILNRVAMKARKPLADMATYGIYNCMFAHGRIYLHRTTFRHFPQGA